MCCKRSGMRVVPKQCFHNLFDFTALRLWMALLTMCLCFCLLFGMCASHGDYFIDGDKSNDASLMLVVIFSDCNFSKPLNSAAFGDSATCCERSGVAVFCNLCFPILFYFVTLRSKTAFLTSFSFIWLFCGVWIFHKDYVMEILSYEMPFREFRYIKWYLTAVVLFFAYTDTNFLYTWDICVANTAQTCY